MTNDFAGSDPEANPTTLDAAGLGRVAFVAGSVPVILSDFTATNGYISGTGTTCPAAGCGAGVYSDGPLTLMSLNVVSNTARSRGGGLYATGNVIASSTQIVQNSSNNYGGGLYANSTLNITDTTFLSNTASSVGGGAFAAGPATLTGGRFENNVSIAIFGGGLYASSTLNITGTTFVGNRTLSDTGGGGGLYAFGKTTVNGGRFERNSASNISGGGMMVSEALAVTDTVFVSNTARFDGGGAYVEGTATVTGGRFESNQANSGGGARVSQALTVSGTQFLSNTAVNGSGGGLYANSTLNITGTQFVSNTATGYGGGAYTVQAATLSGAHFERNHANYGGGMSSKGALNVSDTYFAGNTSGYGGGLFVLNTLALTDAVFVSNTVQTSGGGAYATQPTTVKGGRFENNLSGNGAGLTGESLLDVDGAVFVGNTARNNGGGLYGFQTIVLTGTQITGNVATFGGGLYGNGAVSSSGGWFVGNTASGDGGGLYAFGTTLVTGTQFVSNAATSSNGGGAYLNGVASITGTQFLSNTAVNGSGGGLYGNNVVSISGGRFLNSTSMTNGGGLFGNKAVSITGTEFQQNRSTASSGAGLFATGTLSVVDGRFLDNTAAGAGGGLYANAAATLNGGRFEGNQVTSFSGGGLYSSFSSGVTLSGTVFVSNSATSKGGGVYASGVLKATGAYFERNKAKMGGDNGGGGAYASGLSLTNTVFVGNTSSGYGGGAATASGYQATLSGGRFESNRASSSGGGLYALGPLAVADTVFVSNTAQTYGGGAYLGGAGSRIENALLARNSAPAGAALYCVPTGGVADVLFTTIVSPTVGGGSAIQAAAGTVRITDTIAASYTVPIRAVSPGQATEDYNLFSGTGDVVGPVTSGGHSVTGPAGFVDAVTDDYHLTDASMAVDMGVDQGVYDDLDAVARPRGLGFDVGAYESPYAHAPNVTVAKSVTPAVVDPGEIVTYTLTISNAGLVRAAGVWITDVVPAELRDVTYASGGIVVTPTGAASYTWRAADLAPGAGGVITLTGVVDALSGVFTNTTSVTATGMITPTHDRDAAAVSVPSSPCYARVARTRATFGSTDAAAVQRAVDRAEAGDLIEIAGTCRGVQPRAGTSQTVYISQTLTVQGGYTITNDFATPDPVANPTTLDAAGLGRVVYVAGGVPVILADLTATNGVIGGSGTTCPGAGCGAGIFSDGALALFNLDVIGNSARQRGGGLYTESALDVTGGRFQSNQTQRNGGGGLYSGPAVLTGTLFISNTAGLNGGGGGAMVNNGTGGQTAATNVRFAANLARSGGGLHVVGGAVVLTDTDFISNTAQLEGGGLNAQSSVVQVSGGRFEKNWAVDTASSVGGGLSVSSLIATGTQFVENGAASAGGANANGGAAITGARFERNQSVGLDGNGGGLVAAPTVYLTDTDFISNTAQNAGGGATCAYTTTVRGGRFEDNRSLGTGLMSGAGGLGTQGALDLRGTVFSRNSAASRGGALGAFQYDLDARGTSIVDALFIDNESAGGALDLRPSAGGPGTGRVLFATIAGPASTGGPAVVIEGGTVGITDTIVSGHTSPISATVGADVREDYNLFHDTGAFLGFVTSGGHSALGEPAFLDPAHDDYHLTDASMAVDIGTDEGVYDDLDGTVRPRGLGFDVGAYESPYAHAPDVTVAKSATPAVAGPGQTITYTLAISNAGLVRATGVWITDVVPAELQDVTYTSSGLVVTPTGAATYVWQAADLAPRAGGLITLTGVVRTNLASGTVFTNTAAVTATGMITPTHDRDAAIVSIGAGGPCYARITRTGQTFSSPNALAVQDAVDAAESGDLIRLAGTCRGVEPRAGTSQTVYISTTLTLQGGYTLTNDFAEPDPAANPTTLDAAKLGRVVFVAGGVPVILADFSATNGAITGSGSTCPGAGCGGGIYSSGALTGLNLEVTGNSAVYTGGGLYGSGPVVLTGATLSGNSAAGGGGAYADSTATVTGGRFEGNNAAVGGGGLTSHGTLVLTDTVFVSNTGNFGGAIWSDDAATLTSGLFVGNSSRNHGGGVYGNSTLVVSDTVFVGNSTGNSGGAVYASSGPSLCTVVGGRFEGNQGGNGGGLFSSGPLRVSGTEFLSNTAMFTGGGVYAYRAATLTGGNFTGNSAPSGGGLYTNGAATVTNGSFEQNEATNGGGLYANSALDLSDTVFVSNTATTNGAGASGGGLAALGTLAMTDTVFVSNTASIQGGGAYVRAGRVVNGLFAHNGSGLGAALYCAPSAGTETDVLFSTVESPAMSGGPAIYAESGTADVVDTIVSGYSVPISAAIGSSVNEDYNVFFNTGAAAGSVVHGGHSVTGDPAFVDAPSRDYHLTFPSVAIDVGADAGVYDDLDGTIRPRGTGYDAGAYESPFAHVPDVTVHKTAAPAIADPGEAVTYTIAFNNAGQRHAMDVVITDVVPAQLRGASYVSNGAVVTPTGSVSYTWQAAALAPGSGGTITLTGVLRADAPLGGVVTNTVTVAASGMLTPTHDFDSASVTVGPGGPCYARIARSGQTFSSADASAVQDAVDVAESGDLIEIAGTCRGVEPRGGANQTVYISTTLTLQGGYTLTNGFAEPDPLANPTTLDAAGLGRVVFITGTAPVILADFTATNGSVSGAGSTCPAAGCGGGVSSDGALTLMNLDVISNTAGGGGGVYAYSTLTLVDTLVTNNVADYGGAGAYAVGAVQASGGRFTGNSAQGGSGGGLRADSSLAISGTVFAGNVAQSGGGGALASGAAALTGARFERNQAGAAGGGLLAVDTVAITNTVFISNTAQNEGGGCAQAVPSQPTAGASRRTGRTSTAAACGPTARWWSAAPRS